MAAQGIDIALAEPNNTTARWPFYSYAYGSFAGLFLTLILSDFLFQKRMIYLPAFVYISISSMFHIGLYFLRLVTSELNHHHAYKWIMFTEGIIDGQV